jgi:hypothetical protein
VEGFEDEREAIRRLVRELGAGSGARMATPEEVDRLRDFFGHRVLRSYVDLYILGKYQKHVEENQEWPDDTTPDEYLASLRDTVMPQSGIYLSDETLTGEWAVYFVGRVRRAWRGPGGPNRVVVIFNAERPRLVSGFQPDDDEAYVELRSGFWLQTV